jgi:hypothetical protein
MLQLQKYSIMVLLRFARNDKLRLCGLCEECSDEAISVNLISYIARINKISKNTYFTSGMFAVFSIFCWSTQRFSPCALWFRIVPAFFLELLQYLPSVFEQLYFLKGEATIT